MTKLEVAELMTMLQANYPDSFRGQADVVVAAKVKLWHDMFKHHPKEVVNAAAIAFMATGTKGFMPNVGQILEQIRRMDVKNDITPVEAWALVYRAIKNSIYWAEEEFKKLPEDVQRFVGRPEQLRDWAMMESEVVQSVIASNFQRSFKARQESDQNYAKLPAEVKQFVARLSENTFGYLEAGEGNDVYET